MTDSNNLPSLSLTEEVVLALVARAGKDGVSREVLHKRIDKALERLQQKGILDLGVEGNQALCLKSFVFTSEYPSLLLLRNNSSVYSSVNTQSLIHNREVQQNHSTLKATEDKPSLHIPSEWIRPPKTEPPESLVSSDLMNWVLIWNKAGVGYKINPNKETKSLSNALTTIRRLRRGSLFNRDSGFGSEAQRKFAIEDFEIAVNNLIMAAKDASFEPTNKQMFASVSLSSFLYNPYSRTPMFRSLFLYYLHSPPQRILVLPDEKDPIVTKNLIRLYREEIIGVEWKPTRKEMVRFIEGANFVVDFFEKHKSKVFNGYRNVTSLDKAKFMWEAIKHDAFDKWKIHPGWFNSERTFSHRLPTYLNKSGVFNNITIGLTVGDRIEETDCQIPSELQ